MYQADLDTYGQWCDPRTEKLTMRTIGWLDIAVPYVTGPTPVAFHRRLLEHCVHGVLRLMCGVHHCQFCNNEPTRTTLWYGNRKVPCDNGEIWVSGGDVIYVAPAMVYHYVTEHGYCPPDEFIDAVMQGPLPGTAEYCALITRWGMRVCSIM
ncbi:MAG: hypothetical protein HXY39_19135 [Chloroflexi bacterium]|nr:hypothetical protein [Chloroflexota bacterium]